MLRDAVSLCEVSRYPVRYSPGGHFHFEKDAGAGRKFWKGPPKRYQDFVLCRGVAWNFFSSKEVLLLKQDLISWRHIRSAQYPKWDRKISHCEPFEEKNTVRSIKTTLLNLKGYDKHPPSLLLYGSPSGGTPLCKSCTRQAPSSPKNVRKYGFCGDVLNWFCHSALNWELSNLHIRT